MAVAPSTATAVVAMVPRASSTTPLATLGPLAVVATRCTVPSGGRPRPASPRVVGAKLKLLTDGSTVADAPPPPARKADVARATMSRAPVALTAAATASRVRGDGWARLGPTKPAPGWALPPSSDGCRQTRSSGGNGGRNANGSSSDESLRSTSSQPTDAPRRCSGAAPQRPCAGTMPPGRSYHELLCP